MPVDALWFVERPTPQRTPTLDRLAGELGVDLLAVYRRADDDRGWGDRPGAHPRTVLSGGRSERLRTLARTLAHNRPEVVVCHGYASIEHVFVLLWARLMRRPLVMRSDSNGDAEADKPLRTRALKHLLLRALLPRRTWVWTVGSANDRYWRRYGFRRRVLIPYEVPVLPAGDADGARRVRALAACGEATVLLLFVGRLSPEKGLRQLVDAYRAWAPGKDVRLLVVGDGPQRGAPWLSDAAGLIVVGPVPHDVLGSYYRAADCLVVPSLRDAWGLVVNEAAGHGLPYVLSRHVGASADLALPGLPVFDPGDPADVARALDAAVGLGRRRTDPRIPTDTAALMARQLSQVHRG